MSPREAQKTRTSLKDSQPEQTMIILVTLSLSLLEGFGARPIPDYDQCLEKCGEDPLDDAEKSHEYDECRDKCVEDGHKHCIGTSTDPVRRRKCTQEAQKRCIENCGDEEDCIEFCFYIYA
ncbi:hypothetical protein CRM22_006551 [Opisthorchis felineus]|uniref:Uncharacterized protein n=1 Tax=Opisthorchis felineus TaxID=147828 RepID=A0A4S2LKI4_OPIFE|nr:hypothetical protein CRM22_006551 [Opisthorchis felineus]TGZ64091.1 hypothetical protein CRM22_006551 [Opisthorchis felineus]